MKHQRYGWDKMAVGQSITVEPERVASARVAMYVFSKRSGRKFKSKTDKSTGNLVITRVE